MRYPAAEKLEIVHLVERSHLPVRRTLAHLGIPPATFHRWCDQYQAGGPGALDDKPSRPGRVWNRIPDGVRGRVIDLALAEPELSPRELAVRFTDQERYFVSAAPVLAGGGTPARGAAPGLCFHGPGGELLGFAPRAALPPADRAAETDGGSTRARS